MRYRPVALVLACLVVAACSGSGSPSAAPAGSGGVATATPTTAPGAASPTAAAHEGATSEYCSLFTVDEVQAILGAPVGPGDDAALGTGCQWDGTDPEGGTMLQIQVIDDPSFYVEQSGAEGFEAVSGIGAAAFVVDEIGGWSAQAQTDAATYAVIVRGGTATRLSAISLLKTLVERR